MDDIIVKHTDLLQEYEHFLLNSKEKVSGLWSNIKLWFLSKMIFYIFLFFTKNIFSEEIRITPLNYNLYSSRKNRLNAILQEKNKVEQNFPNTNIPWALKALLNDFSRIFSRTQSYNQKLEVKLAEVEEQINQDIVFMKDVEEFDFDNYVQPKQDESTIGCIESDEDIEDLLNLLTK